MNRRHFLRQLPFLAALPAGLTANRVRANAFQESIARNATTALQMLAGPYLQYLDEISMGFVWITNVDCVAHLEYGEEEPLTNRVYPAHHGLIDAYTHIHSVRISDLTPGKLYHYRVSATENKGVQNGQILLGETLSSDTFSFRVPEKEKRNSISWSLTISTPNKT